MPFVKGGPPGNPYGRPVGSKNKTPSKADMQALLAAVEAELAEIRQWLPKGLKAEDYLAGQEAAKRLLGKQ